MPVVDGKPRSKTRKSCPICDAQTIWGYIYNSKPVYYWFQCVQCGEFKIDYHAARQIKVIVNGEDEGDDAPIDRRNLIARYIREQEKLHKYEEMTILVIQDLMDIVAKEDARIAGLSSD